MCACVFSGLPGVDAHVPRLSFSAALTVPMERAGTIVFDKVFVNEGDFYDPRTGKHERRLSRLSNNSRVSGLKSQESARV